MAVKHRKTSAHMPPAPDVPPPAPPYSIVPLVASVGVLWATFLIVTLISVARNAGHFIYALDDAYIHMAIAKNIVQHGVWGVTPHEFASASSSYLWTFLLTLAYLVSGVNTIAPFVLNIIAATLVLLAGDRLLRAFQLPAWYVALTLLLLAFVTPLVSLSVTGMEHVLHVLLLLLFAGLASRVLARDGRPLLTADVRWVYVLTVLLVLARFESLAVVMVSVLLFLLRRRWRDGLVIAALAGLVVLVSGSISVAHGGLFLPNSVMVKGQATFAVLSQPSLLGLVWYQIVALLLQCPYLGYLSLTAIILLGARARLGVRFWEPRQVLLVLFVSAVVLHLLASRRGNVYRYEAYLMGLGVFALMASLYPVFSLSRDWFNRLPVRTRQRISLGRYAVVALLLLSIVPLQVAIQGQPVYLGGLFDRAVRSLLVLPIQTTNIYQQQVQMGRFLHRYYDRETVVANDIGALTFFTNIRLFDLEGLGTTAWVKLRRQVGGAPSREVTQRSIEARGARLAIIYENWYRDPMTGESLLPKDRWVRVARWQIMQNYVCGGDTVSFFAIDPALAPKLAADLRAFEPELPVSPVPVMAFYD